MREHMQGSSDGACEWGYARGKGVALACGLAPPADHQHVNDAMPAASLCSRHAASALPAPREGLEATQYISE